MSFLSATFLIALPLVAVPVAIHLYRGRQRDVILWGAMHFLAAAVTKGRRMERLEELLLMALRLAAVAALILALARPMVRSSWFGNTTDSEVILVLDNSLSMSREVDGQSASGLMEEQALEFIDSLSQADGVQILLAAGSEWATAESIAADSAGRQRLRNIVEAADPTLGSADLLACLQAAVHLQAENDPAGRRIVLFTDNQASSWSTDTDGAWRKLKADCDLSAIPIVIEVVDCGLEATEVENLAVSEVHATRNLIRPGDHVELVADIVNCGHIETGKTGVEWLLGDKVVETTPLGALAAGAKTQVTGSVLLADPGIFSITCRVTGNDQLPLDQENSLVVEVADQLAILFVEGNAEAMHSVTAAELFAAALGFKNNEPQAWHSVFRPETISLATLASHPLGNYRAIVINNLGDLDAATRDRLDSFVRGGGGVWVALGDAVDRTWFNRDWYSEGDGLSSLGLESLEVIAKPDDVAATVHPPTRDHQATLQLANTTQLDIDEARMRQRWIFSRQPSADSVASALLESGDGQPLAIEKYVGQGRVLVQAFPLGLEWSNLPLLKAYVVMIHDWLGYVTAPTIARYNLSPGAPIIAAPPKDAAGVSAALITPRGREISLMGVDGDVTPAYRYSQTQLPGDYRVRFTINGLPAGEVPFHVAYDDTESIIEPLTDAARDQLLATAGLQFSGKATLNVARRASAPRREPFWGFLLAALVTLLVGELFMSTRLARQRSGMAVSAA